MATKIIMERTPVDLAPRAAATSQAASNSASGFLSTLIPVGILACVYLGIFLVLRTKQQRIYQPRTYLGALSEHQRTPKSRSTSKFGWISEFMHIRDEYVLNHHSIDAYFYLRFFRTIVFICAVGWPLTWAVLMPVYGTSHGGQQQFDKISFSNIDTDTDAARLFAPAAVAWVFLGFTMFVIGRESIHFVQVRQAFLTLPGIASRMSSRTVLFTNVPKEYLTLDKIRETLPNVKHIWIAMDTKDLEDDLEDRQKTALKLEAAEVGLSRDANKRRMKAEKKGQGKSPADGLSWLDEKKRPTHRLKFLIGKKVDTIDWCRSHLAEMIPKVDKQQAEHIQGHGTRNSAVFVEFRTVQAAESAFHQTHVKLPKQFRSRTVGTRPQEIIWKNLNLSESQRKIRNMVAIALIVLMIIFWGPITAFIGAVSNINNLIQIAPFLSFISSIPPVILGVVTGLLPVILLAILMALVPIIMQLLFKLAGAATLAEVQLKTQTWYFVFQVIQVFLVTTLASGAAAAVSNIISTPSQAPTLLAKALPKASNFYINYLVLFGVSASAAITCNIVAVLLYKVLGKFLDKTPRKMYNRYIKIAALGWGSIYPKFTLLGVIALSYSCIAPLILAFATIGLFLLYTAFRYQVIYATDTTPVNTQGRSFAKALNQLMTGVYLSELCLIGLFAIATASKTIATGPLVMTIVLLVCTIVFQVVLGRTIKSLEKNLSHDDEAGLDIEKVSEAPKDGNGATSAHLPGPAVNNKPTNFLEKLLRPPPLPAFDAYLSTPIRGYSVEDRDLAYMDPAITMPTPLIWIARDSMGISNREKAETGKVVACSDEGAYFDEKSGKVMTGFSNVNEDKEGIDWATLAPIHERDPLY